MIDNQPFIHHGTKPWGAKVRVMATVGGISLIICELTKYLTRKLDRDTFISY